MRLRPNIFVVDGARRAALYDLNTNVCFPLSSVERVLLHHLANGVNPLPANTGLAPGTLWATLASLRLRGHVEPGAPVKRELKLPREATASAASRFKRVWFELTNACNLECGHCYSESSPHSPRQSELPIAEWRSIAKRFIDFGVDWITLIGGEPLVRLDAVYALIAFIREKSKKVKIAVFSNLFVMPHSEEWFRFLQENNVYIGTSLYGTTPAQHDLMTKRKGSWERTTQAIRALRQRKIPVFAGIYVNATEAVDEEEYSQWARSLGLEDFKVHSPARVGRGATRVWETPRQINTLPKSKRFGFGDPLRLSTRHNCFHDHLSVRHDGHVLPCIMMRNSPSVNISQSTVADYLNSPVYKEYSQLSKEKIDGCKVCEFRYGCFDCRPEAIGTGGSLYAKPDCGYDPLLDVGSALASDSVTTRISLPVMS